MYANEAVDSFKKIVLDESTPRHALVAHRLIPHIKNAAKFYVGEMNNLVNLGINTGKELFRDEKFNLPGESVWVSWDIATPVKADPGDVKLGLDTPTVGTVPKEAVLAIKIIDTLWEVYVLHYFSELSNWTMNPNIYVIAIGGSALPENKKAYLAYAEENKYQVSKYDNFFVASYFLSRIEGVFKEDMDLASNVSLSVFHIFLRLYSCLNVQTEVVTPSKIINKMRKQKGKSIIYPYNIFTMLGEGMLRIKDGQFRTYTADKPLFGKHAGTYWWQPKLRQSCYTVQ